MTIDDEPARRVAGDSALCYSAGRVETLRPEPVDTGLYPHSADTGAGVRLQLSRSRQDVRSDESRAYPQVHPPIL